MRVAVIGSNGRMGQEILKLAHRSFANDLTTIIPVDKEDNFSDIAHNIDLVIDFSTTEAFPKYLKICLEHNVRFLSGVTGLSVQQKQMLEQAALKIPVFWAPNMSIGVAVTRFLLENAARILGNNFKIHMKEIHHIHKIDAPSGTAIMLKNAINQYRNEDFDIISVREGEIAGEHLTSFESSVETIEINHKAKSRSVFAEGAIKCAIWLSKQQAGRLYGMEDFIKIQE
jgi:4-hydroxy-tetrahydrodipicolinate reductase